MGLSLITKAEYKTYQNISSTTSDALIDSLIPKVSDLVKSYCRRTFVDYVDEAKVEYTDGGTPTIELLETPIISINSVEFSTDYGNTYTALTEYVDYAFSKTHNNIVRIPPNTVSTPINTYTPYLPTVYPNIFPPLINGYKITYNAGYETLPEDLKLVVLDIVAYYVKNDSAVHTHKNANPNTMQVEYISSVHFPAHIKRILDLYTASFA